MLKAYAVSTASGENIESVSQLAKLLTWLLQKLPFFFAGILLLVFTFFIAKIAKGIVERKLAEKGLDEEHKEVQVLAGRLVYAGVLIVGITAGLNIAGIDLTSIIAAAAFGIGFALRDLIVNFIAGIMILLGRDFTIGDFIKVNGQVGRIEAIQSRVTIMKAVNGTKMIVPNSILFKNNITSFTGNPLRRFDISVPVDYRNNLDNAIKIMLNAALKTKGVLANPKPSVAFSSYGDDGFTVKVKAWCESRSGWVKIRTKLAKAIVEEFDKYGIEIPYTTYNVNQYKDIVIDEKEFKEAPPSMPIQAIIQNQAPVSQGAPVQSIKPPQTTPIVQSVMPQPQNMAPVQVVVESPELQQQTEISNNQ